MSGFVHLHLHSEYSLLDGACRVSDIPAAVKAQGQTAVAITDHGNMFGAVKFYKACVAEGVKPIIGCEVYVAVGKHTEHPRQNDRPYHHLILLCKNDKGYENLIKLVSLGYTEGFYKRPRVDDELLAKYSDGLICLSACMVGYIPQAILRGEEDKATQYALKLNEIFGEGNFYLEIQDHSLADDKTINEGVARISKSTGIPMVATNDVHYLRREDAETQAVLMAVQMNKTIDEGRNEAFETDEFYLRSEDEMRALFSAYEGAVDNTVRIAEQCSFDFDFSRRIFPTIDLEGADPHVFLYDLVDRCLDEKIRSGKITFTRFDLDTYKKRIEYELSVICSMGFAEYYLIVWDFVKFARENDVPVGPGRGSGAGSLVAYIIGITDIDPIEYDLLFEAFLNPERVSMPDFDIDFHHQRRDEVFEYVKRKYGEDRVSKIITFGTLAARAAIRDVGRALGLSYAEVDAVAKAIPQNTPTSKIKLADALKTPELKKMYESSERVRRLCDISLGVEGMPRNMSTHAAGVVISDKPVSDYAPLAVSGNVTVTQFDMDSVSSLGLLKFDFLGLTELTTIDNCVRAIRERVPNFDIDNIPLDDKKTYELLSRGDTVGVFQLESSGMRRMLAEMKPSCIRDVMVALALYRPGSAKFIDTFLANRKSGKKLSYPIPSLAAILDETNGCIVYQEQVMEIFRAVAGYSYAKADIVRRAISKKKHGVIEAERVSFIEGAVSKGAGRESAEKLFDDMIGFSNYGFKKSHAAAYGILSYRTAYLKANYPTQYFAALISSELGNTAKVAQYIEDAKRFGVRLLVPDINESTAYFTVTPDNNIRYGLLALKNVGSSFASAIVAQRQDNPFSGFADFLIRMSEIDSNKKQIESLIKAGAFDSFGTTRSTLLASYEEMLELLAKKSRADVDGQMDMFSSDSEVNADYKYKDLPELEEHVKLKFEKEVSGLYLSSHPLDRYRDLIRDAGSTPIGDLTDTDSDTEKPCDHTRVTVSGMITGLSKKDSRNGKMTFVTLEDKTGVIEIIVFPALYNRAAELLIKDSLVTVSGEINSRENETPKIVADDVHRLGDVKRPASQPPQVSIAPDKRGAAAPGHKLYLRVDSLASPGWSRAEALINIFGGDTAVVVYDASSKKYSALSNKGVSADAFVLGELKEVLGAGNVVLK